MDEKSLPKKHYKNNEYVNEPQESDIDVRGIEKFYKEGCDNRERTLKICSERTRPYYIRIILKKIVLENYTRYTDPLGL